MLKLRSTASAIDTGCSPSAKVLTCCAHPVLEDGELRPRQVGHEPPLVVGDRGIDLDQFGACGELLRGHGRQMPPTAIDARERQQRQASDDAGALGEW